MITLTDLVVGYNKPLMKPLNLTFESGKIYGILGKSGCGKSTLLKTIAKMQKQISGTVTRDDKSQVYMMHQKYTNFNWLDCLDNVLIAERSKKKRKESEAHAKKVLKQVGLEEYLDRYPTELSGGMQQRLALARVLFVKPKILLMDEPLSALDDNTRAKIQKLIMDIHKETSNTIIMVTHSVEEAHKMCDEIIQL
jgi:ABC-type nitrate/sulfonate/bicarbonate transport system ATPase subunit